MKVFVGAKALVLQLLAILTAYIFLSLLHSLFGFTVAPILFFFSCGVIAAMASWFLRFDWWWGPIQLFFPSSIYLALQLNLSPWVYFLALILSLLLFWSTHRTQVPYYPSSDIIVEPILELLNEFQHPRLIDVGCGFGGLLFKLERRLESGVFYGIEIAPLPYLICLLRKWLLRTNVKFLFGAYEKLNFAEYDVVFCYLSPVAMPAIWAKASSEMRGGTLLLSYEFIITERDPSFVLEFGVDAPPLYGWRI